MFCISTNRIVANTTRNAMVTERSTIISADDELEALEAELEEPAEEIEQTILLYSMDVYRDKYWKQLFLTGAEAPPVSALSSSIVPGTRKVGLSIIPLLPGRYSSTTRNLLQYLLLAIFLFTRSFKLTPPFNGKEAKATFVDAFSGAAGLLNFVANQPLRRVGLDGLSDSRSNAVSEAKTSRSASIRAALAPLVKCALLGEDSRGKGRMDTNTSSDATEARVHSHPRRRQ